MFSHAVKFWLLIIWYLVSSLYMMWGIISMKESALTFGILVFIVFDLCTEFWILIIPLHLTSSLCIMWGLISMNESVLTFGIFVFIVCGFLAIVYTILGPKHRLELIGRKLRVMLIRIRRLDRKYYYYDSKVDERWSNGLPQEILLMVLQKLCISDYLVFPQVCVSWRAAVKMGIATKSCLPAPQLPRLLLVSSTHHFIFSFHIKDQISFVSDGNGKIVSLKTWASDILHSYKKDQSRFWGVYCLGSIEGWLIMAKGYPIVNFFLNPVSGARVMLPSFPDCHSFKKVVASSVPTRLQHCIVAGITSENRLAFCRPNDASWTLIEQGDAEAAAAAAEGREEVVLKFYDIEIFDGKLYACSATTQGMSEFLIVIDIIRSENGNGSGQPSLSYSYTPQYLIQRPISMLLPSFVDGSYVWVGPYLAKDSASKELFMIFRKLSDPIIAPEANPGTAGFRVFKLVPNSIDPWCAKEVVDLGDRMLFLSSKTSEFISYSSTSRCLSDHRSHDHNTRLERNCIYFAFMPHALSPYPGRHESGVFSLASRRIQPLAFPKVHSAVKVYHPCVWFTPNPW